MTRTVEYYKVRIHKLSQRDPIGNQRIVNKLKRKVKAMENKGQE